MKLLVTARDAGAAFNIIEIVKQAHQDKEIDLYVYAQKPAADYFLDAEIKTEIVSFPAAKNIHSPEANALMDFSRQLLNEIKPDAILAGLSTPIDAGLDEAMIFSAKGKVPSFVMQDFWGEANNSFGALADCYLALDEDAVKLTDKLHQAHAIAVGSPRHSIYQKINFSEKRAELRKELNIRDDINVVGFFGQALHHIPGYHITIKHWAQAIQKVGKNCCILYRKHPRENMDQSQKTIELLKQMKLDFRIIDHPKVVDSLLACDVVCSLFSNCSYDASYLNYFSSQPFLVPMVLFFEPSIIQYFTRTIQTDELPYLEKGLAVGVNDVNVLADKMQYALSEKAKINVWNACKSLSDPTMAASRALNIIKKKSEITMDGVR